MVKLVAIKDDIYLVFNTVKMRFYRVSKENTCYTPEIEEELKKCRNDKYVRSYTVSNGSLLATVIGVSKGKYMVATSDERVMFSSEDELLRVMRRVKCSNVGFKVLREGHNNESIVITNTFESFKNLTSEIPMGYDKYEILNIKKIYKEIVSEHNGESECYGNGNLSVCAFGDWKEVKIQSDSDVNFLNYYRSVWAKISNDTSFIVYKIFNRYEIRNSELVPTGEIYGYYIKWKDGAETFVLKSDLSMSKLTEIKAEGQFSEKNSYGLIGLYSYGSSEITGKDSIITSMEKADQLNIGGMRMMVSLIKSGNNAQIGISNTGELDICGTKLKMKYRVHIDARDNKTLETRCAGEIRAEAARRASSKVTSK